MCQNGPRLSNYLILVWMIKQIQMDTGPCIYPIVILLDVSFSCLNSDGIGYIVFYIGYVLSVVFPLLMSRTFPCSASSPILQVEFILLAGLWRQQMQLLQRCIQSNARSKQRCMLTLVCPQSLHWLCLRCYGMFLEQGSPRQRLTEINFEQGKFKLVTMINGEAWLETLCTCISSYLLMKAICQTSPSVDCKRY